MLSLVVIFDPSDSILRTKSWSPIAILPFSAQIKSITSSTVWVTVFVVAPVPGAWTGLLAPALTLGFALPLESSAAVAVVTSFWLPTALTTISLAMVIVLLDPDVVSLTIASVLPFITAIATLPATAVCCALAPAIASVVNLWAFTSGSCSIGSSRPTSSSSAAFVSALPTSDNAFLRFAIIWSPMLPFIKAFNASISTRPSVRSLAILSAML